MRSSWMVMAAMAGVVSAQAFGDLAACGQNCINNLRQSVACVPVTDQCLCSKPEFLNGIRDCVAAACSKSDANAALSYASLFCTAATAPAASAQSSATSQAVVESPTTSPKSETTQVATPTTAVAIASTTSASQSSSSVSSSRSSSTLSSTTSATPTSTTQSTLVPLTTSSASAKSSTLSTPSSSSSTSVSSTSASATPAAATDDSSSSNTGLSQAARIGVGVGATAAGFVVLAFLAIFLVRRRRGGGGGGSSSSSGGGGGGSNHGEKPSRAGMIKISDPLPGSGRTYAGDRHNAKYITGSRRSRGDVNELENFSRRYEDLLPRRDPHPMV